MTLLPRFRPGALFRRAAMIVAAGLALGTAGPLHAEEALPAQLDPIVVTATRSVERAFDLPLAIDVVGVDQIQCGQLQIDLSESPARVPGISIQSRWNYAQDLQVSIRGFGALNNFTNVNYVGSVIVGDANGRYFEPAARRNSINGASANASF